MIHRNFICFIIGSKANLFFVQTIPQAFTCSSPPKISSSTTLCGSSGKNWKIRYIYYQDKEKGSVSGGWASFVFAYKIEELDVCVFELIQSNKKHVKALGEKTPSVLRCKCCHFDCLLNICFLLDSVVGRRVASMEAVEVVLNLYML